MVSKSSIPLPLRTFNGSSSKCKATSFLIKDLRKLKSFARQIVPFLTKGSLLSISGELGVGKTTLAQFLCSELGVREKVTSPTFTILKRYWSKKRNLFINHFDFFRLASENDVEAFYEIRDEAINIIEWPEKIPSFFSQNKVVRVKIFFHQSVRRIEVFCNL